MNAPKLPNKPGSALFDQAAHALARVLRFEHPADAVLSAFFREHRQLGARDRAFIAESTYLVLRRLRWLRRVAGETATARKLLLTAMVRLQGLGMKQLSETVSKNEAEWVQGLPREFGTEPSLGERTDLPDWLIERLAPQLGEDALVALSRALNQSAQLDLRVNPMKAERDAVLAQLQAEGLPAQACPWSPLGIRIDDKPALNKHPLFESGAIEVQDEGSQLLAWLVAPRRGEMVVDFCAGAGGKTLVLGALMRSTGRLYAFDVAEKRLSKLKPRLARSGLSNVHPVLIAGEHDARVKRLAGKIDRVLVDAPCSGLGTLRRNPDLKWRQSPAALAELTRKQHDILAAASRLVKVGGRLVYATCSLLQEENEAIVDAFLAAHSDFERISAADALAQQRIGLDTGVDLKLSPVEHGTDGFYAAVLERRR